MGLPAFRSAGDRADPTVLLVHGYPESSHMWRTALHALAESGLYAVAPDLPGFGDSEPGAGGTNTWERHVEALEALRVAEGLGRVALVGHDWGGLIGLRWACDRPDAVWAIVASDTGFFADGRWHGMADAMRTPGHGEELVDGMTLEGFTGLLGSLSTGRAAGASSSSTAAATSRSSSPTKDGSPRSACRSSRSGARRIRSRRSPARSG